MSRRPSGFLDEAARLNLAFFAKVKEIVTATIANPGNQYQKVYRLAEAHLWAEHDRKRRIAENFSQLRALHGKLRDCVESVRALAAKTNIRTDETNARMERKSADLEKLREMVRISSILRRLLAAPLRLLKRGFKWIFPR
jgi:hypothetical protein